MTATLGTGNSYTLRVDGDDPRATEFVRRGDLEVTAHAIFAELHAAIAGIEARAAAAAVAAVRAALDDMTPQVVAGAVEQVQRTIQVGVFEHEVARDADGFITRIVSRTIGAADPT